MKLDLIKPRSVVALIAADLATVTAYSTDGMVVFEIPAFGMPGSHYRLTVPLSELKTAAAREYGLSPAAMIPQAMRDAEEEKRRDQVYIREQYRLKRLAKAKEIEKELARDVVVDQAIADAKAVMAGSGAVIENLSIAEIEARELQRTRQRLADLKQGTLDPKKSKPPTGPDSSSA